MITEALLLSAGIWLSLALLVLSFLVTVARVIRGPTLGDRVVALDMLVGIAIGFIAVIAIKTGFTLYIDVAIALGLVGFLATVALARFILARGAAGAEGEGAAMRGEDAGERPENRSKMKQERKV